jgi:hypothetical protein
MVTIPVAITEKMPQEFLGREKESTGAASKGNSQ